MPAPPSPALHDTILAALDSALELAEWETANYLVYAMEALCHDDELDPRLAAAYLRVQRASSKENPLNEARQ